SGAAEGFGEDVRVDPRLAKARPNEKNDRSLPVVIGQLLQQVVERPPRDQPEPRNSGGQAGLGQDKTAEGEQLGAEPATRARVEAGGRAPPSRRRAAGTRACSLASRAR